MPAIDLLVHEGDPLAAQVERKLAWMRRDFGVDVL